MLSNMLGFRRICFSIIISRACKHDGRTSHALVWHEWKHVRRVGLGGVYPHHVCIRAHNLIRTSGPNRDKQIVPHNPLDPLAPTKLHFNVAFMEAVAATIDQRITYRGVAMVGSKVDFYLDVPDGGKDIQDTPAPNGHY